MTKLTKANAKRLAEAKASIARLNAALNSGDNRYGQSGQSTRDAIARWQLVLDELS